MKNNAVKHNLLHEISLPGQDQKLLHLRWLAWLKQNCFFMD